MQSRFILLLLKSLKTRRYSSTVKVDDLDKDVSEREIEISRKNDIVAGLENEILELKKKLKV